MAKRKFIVRVGLFVAIALILVQAAYISWIVYKKNGMKIIPNLSRFEFKEISKVPIKISRSGYYRMTKNLVFNYQTQADNGGIISRVKGFLGGKAIWVEADNVTIDLCGFTLSCEGDQNHQNDSVGIYAHNQHNIKVVGGRIKNFDLAVFLRGINERGRYASTYGWHKVTELTVEKNRFGAIRVEGIGNKMENNKVIDTHPSTGTLGNWRVFAIDSTGPMAEITGNTIINVEGAGRDEGVGITINTSSSQTMVTDNTIINPAVKSNPETITWAIWIGNECDGVVVSGNHIVNFDKGWGGYQANQKAVFENNTLVDCSTPFVLAPKSKWIVAGSNRIIN